MSIQTDALWYYYLHDHRVGPRSTEQMRELLSTAALPLDVPVWTRGLESWVPASEAEAFTGIAPVAVEVEPGVGDAPADGATEGKIVSPEIFRPDDAPAAGSGGGALARPRPWHRWGARTLDTLFFAPALLLLAYLVAPGVIEGLASGTVTSPAINALALLLTVPVEALFLSAFGATPGKRLFRIRVRTAAGERLRFDQAFQRTLTVWWAGLAGGLPYISMLAHALAYRRLMLRGATRWDEEQELRVEHAEVGVLSWVAIALLFFGVGAMLVLAVLSRTGALSPGGTA